MTPGEALEVGGRRGGREHSVGPPRGSPHPSCPRSVTPMSSSHVRSSDAYLLFYELASPASRM